MKIHDPNLLFSNPGMLLDAVRSHPFLPGLDNLISSLTVKDGSEPCVNVTGRDVVLTIPSPRADDYPLMYVLYHELGHVADRFNPDFRYLENERMALPDLKLKNFIEL